MKTTKMMGMLALTCILTFSSVFAGNEGGGGAGICLEGKTGTCKTLAETGFRLAPETPEFEIDQATLDTLEDIQEELPAWLKEKLGRRTIIGNKGTVVTLQIEDANKVKIFIDEYKKLILKQSPNFDFTNFELLAFSVENTTYLVNDKFKKMTDPMSRAILLMHETYIRVYKSTVANAIRMDGMVIDYLNAKRDRKLGSFDFWNFYKVVGDTNLIDKNLIRSMMVADLLKKGMPEEEFREAAYRSGDSISMYMYQGRNYVEGRAWGMTYSKMLDLRKYHPRIAQDLGDLPFAAFWKVERAYLTGAVYEYWKENIRRKENEIFKATAEYMNQLLATMLTLPKYAHYKELRLCKDVSDNAFRLRTVAFDENTSVVAEVNCNVKHVNRYGDETDNRYSVLANGLNGLSYAFEGVIKCGNLTKDNYDRPVFSCK